MLRFFRLSEPYRLLVLLLIVVMMALPMLINPAQPTLQELKSFLIGEALNSGKTLYTQLIDDTPPAAAWAYKWTEAVFGRSVSARQMVALAFIFLQACFFGILLINNKAYNRNTFVPCLIFAALALYSFDMLSLSPELLASTALLFSLNNLFKEIEFKVQRDEIIVNLGVSLGLASLFVFSYIVFLIGTLGILMLFTRFSGRKAVLLIFGFALPHAIIFSCYFFWGNQGALIQYFYRAQLAFTSVSTVSFRSMMVLGSVPLLFLGLSFFMHNKQAQFTKYQSQLLQVMLLWLVVATVEIIVTRERTPHSFFTFIPPLSYFISHFFLLLRRETLAEIMLWLFLLGLLASNWAFRGNLVSSVDFNAMFPSSTKTYPFKNKKVAVLGNDSEVYASNELGGYFLNWNLSKEILEHPEYFENVILVDQSFRHDTPDAIVDTHRLLPPFLEKIPWLKSSYKREGTTYVKIKR